MSLKFKFLFFRCILQSLCNIFGGGICLIQKHMHISFTSFLLILLMEKMFFFMKYIKTGEQRTMLESNEIKMNLFSNKKIMPATIQCISFKLSNIYSNQGKWVDFWKFCPQTVSPVQEINFTILRRRKRHQQLLSSTCFIFFCSMSFNANEMHHCYALFLTKRTKISAEKWFYSFLSLFNCHNVERTYVTDL